MSTEAFTLRILMAVFLGFVIGVERQLTGHRIAVRINILVCLGSCMFVLFPMIIGSDISRSAAQIVSGVGFLCSGIIFKDGVNVRGLNTAATIWCTSAIGVLTSSGRVQIALMATTILIAVNLLSRPITKIIKALDFFEETELYYKISISCLEEEEMKIRTIILNYLKNTDLVITNLESGDIIGDKVEIEAILLCVGKRKDYEIEKLIVEVSSEESVFSVGWEII